MPALWPQFITNVSTSIAGQEFKNPGAIANDPPRIGSENNPNFGVDYVPLATPSGRRDFGEMVAKEYISAIKTAQTPLGATHNSITPADQVFILAYGEAFERLYRDGDLDLIDTKDADGNIIKAGKESSEAFEDLCPDPIEVPDPIEEEKKRKKRFDAFIEKYKEDPELNLHKFIFSQFHCIEDGQPQDEVEKLFATKLIREFEVAGSTADKIKYYDWVIRLGSLKYKEKTTSFYASEFRSRADGNYPFFNLNSKVVADIIAAGYNNPGELINNIVSLFISAVATAYPKYTEQRSTGNYVDGKKKFEPFEVVNINDRILRGAQVPIITPWPFDPDENPECPLSNNKIQVAYDVDSSKPKILTSDVIAFLSYDETTRNVYNYTGEGEEWYTYYKKDATYVDNKYNETEYKRRWLGVPSVNGNDTVETLKQKMKLPAAGTLFKFNVQSAIDAKAVADECDANEIKPDIGYDYPSGDPYEELAAATITYWYSHLIQPFKPMPAMLPALASQPLGGIYIPIYYGSQTRLAKGLRRALNSGKSFDKVPATQPPAVTIATALASVYSLHLLEFKLLYLGGIPVPAVPFVPMVGFVPLVF